mmetsp:Transcript_176497/g.560702  ORF Transcript_176497/g.560702 Transcript_176497/m.560702 type:complete len:451 (+) Transcript_176497:208-1560(+)
MRRGGVPIGPPPPPHPADGSCSRALAHARSRERSPCVGSGALEAGLGLGHELGLLQAVRPGQQQQLALGEPQPEAQRLPPRESARIELAAVLLQRAGVLAIAALHRLGQQSPSCALEFECLRGHQLPHGRRRHVLGTQGQDSDGGDQLCLPLPRPPCQPEDARLRGPAVAQQLGEQRRLRGGVGLRDLEVLADAQEDRLLLVVLINEAVLRQDLRVVLAAVADPNLVSLLVALVRVGDDAVAEARELKGPSLVIQEVHQRGYAEVRALRVVAVGAGGHDARGPEKVLGGEGLRGELLWPLLHQGLHAFPHVDHSVLHLDGRRVAVAPRQPLPFIFLPEEARARDIACKTRQSSPVRRPFRTLAQNTALVDKQHHNSDAIFQIRSEWPSLHGPAFTQQHRRRGPDQNVSSFQVPFGDEPQLSLRDVRRGHLHREVRGVGAGAIDPIEELAP